MHPFVRSGSNLWSSSRYRAAGTWQRQRDLCTWLCANHMAHHEKILLNIVSPDTLNIHSKCDAKILLAWGWDATRNSILTSDSNSSTIVIIAALLNHCTPSFPLFTFFSASNVYIIPSQTIYQWHPPTPVASDRNSPVNQFSPHFGPERSLSLSLVNGEGGEEPVEPLNAAVSWVLVWLA